MQLTEEQQEIADAILTDKRQEIALTGYAGSGKSTVVKYLYDQWGGKVQVMAPTGKATAVLRKKGIPNAITIHSGIYRFKGKTINSRGEEELIFVDNKKGRFVPRVMIDESSMITAKQARDIRARGFFILWVGDPGQLPPVRSERTDVLRKNAYRLKEIHRQAKDSPIIRYAHMVRFNKLKMGDAYPGIEVVIPQRGTPDVCKAIIERNIDRLIVRENAQRVAVNAAYRLAMGRSRILEEGDEIICLQNNKDEGVINGQIFDVTRIIKDTRDAILADIRSQDFDETLRVWMAKAQFGNPRKLDEDEADGNLLFDYGKAITGHKAQGSSWKRVGVAASGYTEDAVAWNYTGITRAEQELTIFGRSK